MTEKELNYFNDLFQRLGPEEEEGFAYPVVLTDGDTIKGTDDLKDYMFAILKSNMQYDFGIDFDDKDVLEFAEAITDNSSDSVCNNTDKADKYRKEFLDSVHSYLDYWNNQQNLSAKDKLWGFAMSILGVIDGVDSTNDNKHYTLRYGNTVLNQTEFLHDELSERSTNE